MITDIKRRIRVVWGILALLATLLTPGEMAVADSAFQFAAPVPWKVIGEGITYREFYLPTPEHVYVARLERSHPQVTIETSIAQGALNAGLETVREMSARYDQAINFWEETWGGRNQVVVAINGYFYDPETGMPQSGLVNSAWYAKRFSDRQSGSGFAWTLDRQAFIGGCVVHNRNKQLVTLPDSGESVQFEAINIPLENEGLPEKDGLVIFTPQYGSTTPVQEARVEALVELGRPLMIMAAPAMITGTVRMVSVGQGQTPLPFDHVVLSAAGEAADWLRSRLQPGTQVGISQELRHFESDCRTPVPLSWSKTYAGIGASFVFLRDGAIQKFDETAPLLRTPRTAVAFNERYVFFIVVDGRDPFRSLGMGMVELAVFARNLLGATWGAALDGGGSSTMVVNGQLMNRPNTEVENPDAAGTVTVTTEQIERAVATGLMMVVVQPRQQSARFQAGTQVTTVSDALVRLGPGTNYASFASLLPGRSGVILPHPLNGVLAKGTYWWKVAVDEIEGWISEDLINILQ